MATMRGKWDKWYKNIKRPGSFKYGDTATYQLGADFLADMKTVEDWGCGTGGFRKVCRSSYIGVDGSKTPLVDRVEDLCEYRSKTDGIFMRHVLAHNHDWEKVLKNAIASFDKKLCIVIFTPFDPEKTKVIADNKKYGVDVPDISFLKKDIEKHLVGLKWRMETLKTRTHYNVEHIYYIEKTEAKIAVISARLGTIEDKVQIHVEQTIPYDFFSFTDENFPPRYNSLTPRMQSKIPKFFGWQMEPGYEHYIWIDGAFEMIRSDTVQWLLDQCEGVDMAFFKHPKRNTVDDEVRRVQIGILQGSAYLYLRYHNEWIDEQMTEINTNGDYVDDILLGGGIFIYKNIPKVQKALKEWWYHTSRYSIEDQLSLPYVLKQAKIEFKVIDEVFDECDYVKYTIHQ